MQSTESIEKKIKALEKELACLEAKRIALGERLKHLKKLKSSTLKNRAGFPSSIQLGVTKDSPKQDKISLFRSLFRGREDVFARRFVSQKSGKVGYQPQCRKQWIRGLCRRPAVKCADCDVRDFLPLSDEIILNHLMGRDPLKRSTKDFTIGIYPLLEDETCWFLAVDFDKEEWKENAGAYLEACRSFDVSAALERSRSGNGGHVWLFFSEAIPAGVARQLGAFILTQAMDQRPEMGFRSYDRFFPSQDTRPKGGFGNLIALPLQNKPRELGNSMFVDDKFDPFPDQWTFLSSIRRIGRQHVDTILEQAASWGGALGVRYVSTEGDDAAPWLSRPSGSKPELPLEGPLPDEVQLVLGNQIYIAKNDLPPALRNRLTRLAAFQNPDFYRAQAMRLPTFGKPRVVHCCEDFPQYIGLPRGCLEDAVRLLEGSGIDIKIDDRRFAGKNIDCRFRGSLRPGQREAVDALLANDTGVLAASTAFGKTVAAAFLIAHRAANTLVLVHRKHRRHAGRNGDKTA